MTSTMRFDKWENSLGQGSAQIDSSGNFYSPGSVVQVQEYRSVTGDKTVTSSTTVDIITASFTTKFANSRLFLTYFSGQMNPGSPQSNARFNFLINGVAISDFETDHIFYSDSGTFTTRSVVTIPIMTPAVTKGTHTVVVRGGSFNANYTFDFQSTLTPARRSRLIIMEIAQ
jgi:hypothetical protein